MSWTVGVATNGGNDPKSKRTHLGYDLDMRGDGASASTGKDINGSGASKSRAIGGSSVKGSMLSEMMDGRGR